MKATPLLATLVWLCSLSVISYAQVYQWYNTNIQYSVGTGMTVTVSNQQELQMVCPSNMCVFIVKVWNDPDFRDPADIARRLFEATPGEEHHTLTTGYNHGVQQTGLENQMVSGTVAFNGYTVKAIAYAFKDPEANQIVTAEYRYTLGVNDASYESHAQSLFNSFRKVH